MAFTDIPDFALSDWSGPKADRSAFAERLAAVCHEVGFLRLVDHGIDPLFMGDYFKALRDFFALPDDLKSIIDKANSPWFRGWERVGAELTDNSVDYREQVDIWTELSPRADTAGHDYLRLEGPNQWPADDLVPGFRNLVERFQSEMGNIANQLLTAMCIGLGLDSDALTRRFGDRGMSLVKLIHYPPTPPEGAGVNAHHDTGFLTLLWQHGVSGLQVQNQTGDWIDVSPDGDAIIVNIGEMLQSMTGNYFVATNHRVICSEERYSSAYFHGPDLETELDALPLADCFTHAVSESDHHREAGFMARRDELLDGVRGAVSAPSDTYGQQIWNYFRRSYPDLVARHHPDLI
ncbi:MAG: 2-oxoglutarate and iron-dependent oxygenase domain-containing protein [Microthrixaceae bacterium]